MPVLRSQGSVLRSATVSTTLLTLLTFGFPQETADGADRIIISVASGALRVAWDNDIANPPTTSTGLVIPAGNYPPFVIDGRTNGTRLRLIRSGAVDAVVSIMIESD